MTVDIEVVLLEELNCCACGIRFGMAQNLYERRYGDNKTFYCPNGHAQSFVAPPKERDVELDELRAALVQAQNELRETKDELARQVAHGEQLAASRRPLLKRPQGRPA